MPRLHFTSARVVESAVPLIKAKAEAGRGGSGHEERKGDLEKVGEGEGKMAAGATELAIDITVHTPYHTGIASTAFVRRLIDGMDDLRAVVLLLKVSLRERR